MPRNYTVSGNGAKEVKIVSRSYKKQRVTAMPFISAVSHKLPPYIILSRETINKNERYPKYVILRTQKMDG
jgi:hypothetical protein